MTRTAWIVLLVLVAAAAMPAAAPPPAAPPSEPLAPAPSAAVQALLAEAARHAQAKEIVASLAAADRALAAARQAQDAEGEAASSAVRALLLEMLNRKPEAITAWAATGVAWQRAGDGPGQVQALAQQALLLGPESPAEALQRAGEAVTLARRETSRPLAAAAALYQAGVQADGRALSALARPLAEGARAIWEELAPGSGELAATLSLLGILASQRGDLGVARNAFQQGLAIREQLAPSSPAVAASLNNLGLVAHHQGDLPAARDYYLREMAIREKLTPGSLAVATSLNKLATVAREQGDVSAARDYLLQARAIQAKLAPGSLAVAGSLSNLGAVAYDQGDLTAARDYHLQALAIRQKLAPGSLVVASSLNNLGFIAVEQRDLPAARDYFLQTLAIGEKLAPDSLAVATSLNNLGAVAREQNDLTSAEKIARQAWDLVRRQGDTVVGDEARQAFGSSYSRYAALLVAVQRAQGHAAEALLTLEEGRAQALQRLLVERGLFERLAPPNLWQAYTTAQRKHHTALQALEAADSPQVKADVKSRAKEQEVRSRVEAQQCLAAVKAAVQRDHPEAIPEPRDPAAARHALAPGTLFVIFSLEEARGVLFLARAGGGSDAVRAVPLSAGAKALESRVRALRELVDGSRGAARRVVLAKRGTTRANSTRALQRGIVIATPPVAPALREKMTRAARELYGMLFPREARAAVALAQRLVISPDGVLWDLPFAALVTNDRGAPAYLGLQKPLCYSQSLTLYTQSLTSPRLALRRSSRTLVIGNPLYDPALRTRRPVPLARHATSGGKNSAPKLVVAVPGKERGGVAVKDQRRMRESTLLTPDGGIPPQLRYAEAEARRIAALYTTKPWTGEAPTEAWFRKEAASADLIHLATHGYFHPRLPLSSGVLLAVPEQTPPPDQKENDGTVQGWELMSPEFPRLKAELVVLSACETAMGQKVSGEGLVGLTRALQVAGARSIVASQWAVADESTKELMVAFHGKLRAGVAEDEALLAAMREVAGQWPGPYHWAPFLLVGDPRNLTLGAGNGRPR